LQIVFYINRKIRYFTKHNFLAIINIIIANTSEYSIKRRHKNFASDKEWNANTIAKLWTVKDTAAYLLDGNLRTLSSSRDKFFSEAPQNINTYYDLVSYLHQLNHIWTNAAKRLSPQVLIHLLEITGKQYAEHLNSLNPIDKAIYSVAWSRDNCN
jgi:hypothetical protein